MGRAPACAELGAQAASRAPGRFPILPRRSRDVSLRAGPVESREGLAVSTHWRSGDATRQGTSTREPGKMKKPFAGSVALIAGVACATMPIGCLWSMDGAVSEGERDGGIDATGAGGAATTTSASGGSGGTTTGGATGGSGTTGGNGGRGASGGSGGSGATGGGAGTAGSGGTGGAAGTGGTGGSAGSGGTGGTTTVKCGTATCSPYEIPGIVSFPACCPSGEANGCGLESMGICLTTTPGTPDTSCPGGIPGFPSQACCTAQKTCGIALGPPFGCNDFSSSQGGTPVPCGGGGGTGGSGGAGGIDAGRGGGTSTDASVPPRIDSGNPPVDSGFPPFDISIPPFDVGGGRG